MRRITVLAIVCVSLLVPAVASAEETLKPITIVGRPAKPSVVIEVKRESPNVGLRPLTPPKSFTADRPSPVLRRPTWTPSS